MKAILLARVSTEEQRDAGNSLPAQMDRMRTYCSRKSFVIEKEYSFDESAYKQKRDEFDRLLEKINEIKETVAVCFDKVDRLSRNVFDKRVAVLYEKAIAGEIELHFVSDGQVINTAMSAVEKFQFGMSLGLAKYYSDAISDNTKRAFEQKRRSGEWTGSVPFGYVGVALDSKKRLRADIIPDPLTSGYVQEIFRLYASGQHSTSTIAEFLNGNNLVTNRGKRFGTSTVHQILTNSFYYGKAYSRKYKTLYNHRYQPLIDLSLFQKVQEVLHSRNQNPVHKKNRTIYTFSNLLTCRQCGCTVCREVKRGKAYLACSNAKKAHRREYVQEEKLLECIAPVFTGLSLSDAQTEQIVQFLRENHEYKARFYKDELKRLNGRFEALQMQKEKLLDLLIQDHISQEDYDGRLLKITNEQQSIHTERESFGNADHKYHVTAKHVLELARRASELFKRANAEEKNQLLRLVLSNVQLDGKNLEFSIRKPFDTIVKVEGFPVGLRR